MIITEKKYQQRAQILDIIYAQGPISRIDISQIAHVTPATMTELSSHLLETGLIHELGEADSGKAGRRKIYLDISPGQKYYIGVELAEQVTVYILSDNLGNIIDQHIESGLKDDQFTYQQVVQELQIFMQKHEEISIDGIGIALPGHYDPEKQRIQSNQPLWRNFDLKRLMEEMDVPVFAKNNVKCMVLSERIFKRKNVGNYTFCHIRRGIFAAAMYNHELYGEGNNSIGEIGHVVVDPKGLQCECGKHGCLQTVISEAWLINKAKILFDSGKSKLSFIIDKRDDIELTHILQAYHLGDAGIHEMLHDGLSYLAMVIKNLGMLVDTDTIYLHSEMFLDEDLMKYLRQLVSQQISLFDAVHRESLRFVPYNIINGALGGAALAVSSTLLNFK